MALFPTPGDRQPPPRKGIVERTIDRMAAMLRRRTGRHHPEGREMQHHDGLEE